MTEPGRQHLLERGQRAQGRFFVTRHTTTTTTTTTGGCSEPDHHRDRLLVVEQERRQRRPGPEPVATAGARGSGHRVTKGPQSFDVVANGSGRHTQAFRELGTGPLAR